jgi:hypothetical protein
MRQCVGLLLWRQARPLVELGVCSVRFLLLTLDDPERIAMTSAEKSAGHLRSIRKALDVSSSRSDCGPEISSGEI